MGKTGVNLMLMIAVVSGLVVAYGLYQMLSQTSGPSDAPKMLYMVIAGEDMPRGTVLNESLLDVISGLEGEIEKPFGSFSSPAELTGRVLKTEASKDDVILNKMLAPDGDGIPLGVIVPPGMRGVVVHVDPRNNMEAFLREGDRVDVVLTQEFDRDELTSSKILLQDVQVLGVPTAKKGDDVDTRRSSTEWVPVALSVYPADAEKLSLATKVGTLQLLVRAHDDEKTVWTSGVTADTLIPDGPANSARDPRKGDLSDRAYDVVEVIKGKDKTEERFKAQPAAGSVGYFGGVK